MPFLKATAALIVGFSTASSAVTLSVNSDKVTYVVGETITLTVTADDEGATDYGIFGRLLYPGSLVNNGTRTQLTLSGPLGDWTTGNLPQTDDNLPGDFGGTYSSAFNQYSIIDQLDVEQTVDNLPGTLSTVTLIAQAIGVVNVTWDTNASSGFRLNFFGLTYAPGTSFTIVPEPAAAALIGLGLLGLAGRRRARA